MSEGPLRIFISWSGARSQIIADALNRWLPCLIDDLHMWLSSDDLRAGQRWNQELAKALAVCDFGIIVVTTDNMLSPWIAFEAGAVSKEIQTARVMPYLVDMDPGELSGPVSQFQAVAANREGTLKLVTELRNLRQPSAANNTIARRFEKFWPELEPVIAESVKEKVPRVHVEQPKIESLREQVAELGQLVRQLISSKGTGTVPLSAPAQTGISHALPSELCAFEGAWRTSSGSHIYARVVNGRLFAPYCYRADDELTGVYRDWYRLEDYWFTRFSWLTNDVHGFAFYRLQNEHRVTGTWWVTDGEVRDIITEPPSRDGVHVVWTRLPKAHTPRWAERYFEEQARHY